MTSDDPLAAALAAAGITSAPPGADDPLAAALAAAGVVERSEQPQDPLAAALAAVGSPMPCRRRPGRHHRPRPGHRP